MGDIFGAPLAIEGLMAFFLESTFIGLFFFGWDRLSKLLLIHPAIMLDSQGNYSHSALSLVMLGISAGFIHGVGFKPRFWLWKILFSPVVGWLLLALGYFLLWQAQGI